MEDDKVKAYVIKASADNLPLKDECIQMVVCSPPYWALRAYDGDQGKEPFGREKSVDKYIQRSVKILRELRRVLKPDGLVFWNCGDSFVREQTGSLKQKDLALVPSMVAIAARNDGWWLRSDIIWEKGNPQPSSASDRPADCYEHIFLFAKAPKYYWNKDEAQEVAQREKWGKPPAGNPAGKWGKIIDLDTDGERVKPGPYRIKAYHEDKALTTRMRNLRDIWKIYLQPTAQPRKAGKEGHPATFPEELVLRCLKIASRPGDYVLDPFGGSGTTAKVALEMGRIPIHSDLSYHDFAAERIRKAKTEERIVVIQGPPKKLKK